MLPHVDAENGDVARVPVCLFFVVVGNVISEERRFREKKKKNEVKKKMKHFFFSNSPELLHQRIVLVRSRLDGERLLLVPRVHEPRPSRAKDARRGRLELLDHFLEPSREREVDLFLQFRGKRRVRPVGAELVKVQEVVVRPPAVVPDGGRSVLGDVLDDGREARRVVDRRLVQKRRVQVRDVGRDVFPVVERDGLVRDRGLEGRRSIGERDDLKGRGRRRGSKRRRESDDDECDSYRANSHRHLWVFSAWLLELKNFTAAKRISRE